MERISQKLNLGIRSGIVFFVLAVFLHAIDLVPEKQQAVAEQPDPVPSSDLREEEPESVPASEPTRVVIESIGVDTIVLTPENSDIQVLDRALLSGAVHYPGSSDAGEIGNMLIFGHSSYLPVVKNKAFQAFNDLGNLSPGEMITVYSEQYRYEYEVDSVRLARAQDTVIDFTSNEPTLTISTCNTFGQKQERFVVRATLKHAYPHRFQ